jgi:cation transport regulator
MVGEHRRPPFRKSRRFWIPKTMPYSEIEDLPPAVRRHLPRHAQEIYLAAFNNAWAEYGGDPRREEIAHRVAWAAVKKLYVKAGDQWVSRDRV